MPLSHIISSPDCVLKSSHMHRQNEVTDVYPSLSDVISSCPDCCAKVIISCPDCCFKVIIHAYTEKKSD